MQLPALAIRQPELGKTLITAAYLKSSKLKNQLTTAKLNKMQMVRDLGAQVMAGGGSPSGAQVNNALTAGGGPTPQAAAALNQGGDTSPTIDANSPAMRALVAADPETGGKYVTAISNMNEEKRKQYKRLNGITARLLLAVENAPEEQRPMIYAQVLQKAGQQGVSVGSAPPQYDPQWVQNQLRVSMALDDELTAVDRKARTEGVWVQGAKGKKWVRKDRLEGMTAQDAPTKEQKNATAMGLKPGTPEYKEFIETAATKPLSVTQVDARTPPAERAEMKAYGKSIGKAAGENYTRYQEAARNVTTRAGNMDQVNSLLDMAYTGAFGETALGMVKGLNALGMTGLADFIGGGNTSMGPAEAGQAISRKMALEARKDMPGPMSDKDREFLVSLNPSLGMTKEGRHLLAEVYKQRGAHVREIAKHARGYKAQREKAGGRFDEGFHAYLEEKMGGKSWFSDDMSARLKLLSPVDVASEAEAMKLPKGQVIILNGRIQRVK